MVLEQDSNPFHDYHLNTLGPPTVGMEKRKKKDINEVYSPFLNVAK